MNFIEQKGVIVGFRPEVFLPAEMATGDHQVKFRFKVVRVENLGSFKLAYGTIGETGVIANLPLRVPLEEGKEYDFSIREKDIRYYNKETGVRIKK
jgi:multiple sugar transport system ATP-binding protein